MTGFIEDQFADPKRGIWPADLSEVFAPFGPLRGVFGKGTFHQFGNFTVFFGDRAQTEAPDQFRVAFLLPGNDLVDNHRAARGDGFLHGRAAGFADDQVVRHHQFGHLVRPAEDADAVGVFARALSQFGAQIRIASDGDGQMHVVQFQQPVDGFAGLFLAGVDDVKHTARFTPGRQRQFGRRVRKNRTDGKAERLDLFRRHAAFAQHLGGGFVGHAENNRWARGTTRN